MNEVTSLNRGDKIIVQKVIPRSAYKNYEMHTVTGFTDNEAALDNGRYFLANYCTLGIGSTACCTAYRVGGFNFSGNGIRPDRSRV